MLSVKLIPFMLAPIVAQGYEGTSNQINKPTIPAQQQSQGIDINSLVESIRNYLKLPELTQRQKEATYEAEEFLKNYTSDETFDYSLIKWFVADLKSDERGIRKEVNQMGLLPKILFQTRHIDLLGVTDSIVEDKIESRGRKEIVKGLEMLGVDPSTEYRFSKRPKYRVTRAKLERFRDNMLVIQDIPAIIPAGKKPIFPNGISSKDISAIRERRMPPGVVFVDIKDVPYTRVAENVEQDRYFGVSLPLVDELVDSVDTGATRCLKFVGNLSNLF